MNTYALEILPRARRDLGSLDRQVARRILDMLEWFAQHFEGLTRVPLTGRWSGLNRLRIGPYRATYSVDTENRTLRVHDVGHRREVYGR